MRRLLALAALALAGACAPVAHAEDLYLSAKAYHFDRDLHLNENNPGVSLEFDNGATIGYFRNSYNKDAYYVAYAYRPLSVGPASFGVLGGAVTGYDLPVLGGLSGVLRLGDVRVHVFAVPASNGFITAQLGWHF